MAFRADNELVSALVCSRDRPEALARAVRSLLATDLKEFELIVIDQSVGSASARAVAPFVWKLVEVGLMCAAIYGLVAAEDAARARHGDASVCVPAVH